MGSYYALDIMLSTQFRVEGNWPLLFVCQSNKYPIQNPSISQSGSGGASEQQTGQFKGEIENFQIQI